MLIYEYIKDSAFFSDHMVLQMGKPINIWGRDYSGKRVKAELCGFSSEVVCMENEWHIVLPPVNTYVGHYELKITDGEAYGSVYRNCYPKDGRLIV